MPVHRAKPPTAAGAKRRGVSGVFAALAVVGLSAAVVAPTGMALAQSSAAVDAENTVTTYALASAETQNITVSDAGITSQPVERDGFTVYVAPKPPPVEEKESTDEEGADSADSEEGGGQQASLAYTGGGDPAAWMAAAGIAPGDQGFVDYIASRESGWNPNATNPSSGACGLIQAYPCSKVPGNGYDPVDNLRWANGYAVGRYGSWAAAYDFWVSNHWW